MVSYTVVGYCVRVTVKARTKEQDDNDRERQREGTEGDRDSLTNQTIRIH